MQKLQDLLDYLSQTAIYQMHGYAFYLNSKKTSNTKLFPLTFIFLSQNTRSNTIYAHTDHALILADFRCSFEWIWWNTIKENDVNFLREKGKLQNMYMNIA